jgi:hypothetical protein
MTAMTGSWPHALLKAIGIEIEFMIVDSRTLSVKGIADELLRAAAGSYVTDIESGPIAWSNELPLHLIELKTNGPVAALAGVPGLFRAEVTRINGLLAGMGATLMPSAMHPWMEPSEFKVWPHGHNEIYEAFDRIFDCRGHGWSNLQACQLNLSFGSDEEFGRLHAAIRLALPILPALAASSPVVEGRFSGFRDTRIAVYRRNAAPVPIVSGNIIPEPVFTQRDYEAQILERIYADLAPLDPEGILRHEWVNSRGCIARFDRGSIEIRLLDTQECPEADLAIAAAVLALVRALAGETLLPHAKQASWSVERLADIMDLTVRDGEAAVIRDAAYLDALGYPEASCRAGELWSHLCASLLGPADRKEHGGPLEVILRDGTLSTRIAAALGEAPDRQRLRAVYADLVESLAAGRMYRGT